MYSPHFTDVNLILYTGHKVVKCWGQGLNPGNRTSQRSLVLTVTATSVYSQCSRQGGQAMWGLRYGVTNATGGGSVPEGHLTLAEGKEDGTAKVTPEGKRGFCPLGEEGPGPHAGFT